MVEEIYLTPGEAGRELEPPVGPDYIRELVDTGRLPARRTPSGLRLIPRSALRRFDEERRQRRETRS
jgi:excisionase family DNA binding protein